jgi:hypothetical protein
VAGQPRRRAIAVELEIRARNTADDEGHTALDYVSEWVESGKTLTKLALELGEKTGFEISVPSILGYLRKEFGGSLVDQRITNARKASGHTLAEEALQIVDDADDSDANTLRKAEMQANKRLWLAERFNRTELGNDKSVAVQINVGSMHIDALRSRVVESRALAFISDGTHTNDQVGATGSAIVADATVVNDDSAVT